MEIIFNKLSFEDNRIKFRNTKLRFTDFNVS